MIDARFSQLSEVCDAVYLTAVDDGYTAPDMLSDRASLHVIPKDGRHQIFAVEGHDLADMIAEAIERTSGWARNPE